MKRLVRIENVVEESRFMWASIAVLITTLVLLFRLWHVQVYRGEYYAQIAERNRIRRIEIPAPRGIIYDRFGQVVLGNRPFFDLVYIPQYVQGRDETFKILSRLMHIPISVFERRFHAGAGRPKYLPITLKRNLSEHEVSVIEANKLFLPGIDIQMAPRRDYTRSPPAHLVGYLGEIDESTLNRYNKVTLDDPYIPGDLVGKHGLEAQWETYLRGKRGFRFIQVDAFGRQTQSTTADWDLPEVNAISGNDLELTIDWKLQQATVEAFRGKIGAVVVLDPRNGEVLAIVSSPQFDPTIYQEGLSPEDWKALTSNPFKPLYDKTSGGEYPPGSVYKAVLALAGLQEGAITPNTIVNCPGYYVLGDQTFQCWEHSGHGLVNLKRALMRSCDVYFYELGVQLGIDKIASYAQAFGLGQKLGFQLNAERPGLVPTAAWKQLVHKVPWTRGDTPNVSIGQGYNLITPIQMASLYATIANSGTLWRPHLVRSVANAVGSRIFSQKPQMIRKVTEIAPENFELVRKYLMEVVMNPEGTGKNARVEGVTIAGKTGSVQVVSLKRNRNQEDVSMKWREHAMFAAFSPAENAEIAIAVISENDKKGGGGASAAPVAGAIIKAYWKLKEEREKILNVSKTEGTHANQRNATTVQ